MQVRRWVHQPTNWKPTRRSAVLFGFEWWALSREISVFCAITRAPWFGLLPRDDEGRASTLVPGMRLSRACDAQAS